jgi:hypothetical protein
METNYIVIYSDVNSSTRAHAYVTIWIHKSINNTIINFTQWSERMIGNETLFGFKYVLFPQVCDASLLLLLLLLLL